MKSESEPAQEGGADHRPGWLNTGLRRVQTAELKLQTSQT